MTEWRSILSKYVRFSRDSAANVFFFVFFLIIDKFDCSRTVLGVGSDTVEAELVRARASKKS